MLGAFVGDCIGSPYEGKLAEDIPASAPLFTEMNDYTDDSVLTIATATALRTGSDVTTLLKTYANRYPEARYGGLFRIWVWADGLKPYGSHGIGGPMRISPAAYAARDEEGARRLAQACAAVTHDSPTAMAASATLAAAIYRARKGASSKELASLIRREMAPFLKGKDLADPAIFFGSACCAASLTHIAHQLHEAQDFTDLMFRLRALGGDTDTLCSIGGAIAEPIWGIPHALLRETEALLPTELWKEALRFLASTSAAA